MKRSVTPPTEAELEKLARFHFSYEVLALIDGLGTGAAGPALTARALAPGVPGHLLGTHDLMLHTRLLAGFLLCTDLTCIGSHNSDVEARHYVRAWPGDDVLGADRVRINKALAHLSRDRLTLGAIPDWERMDMARRVLDGLLAFIESVPTDRRSWFDQSAIAIREALNKHSRR